MKNMLKTVVNGLIIVTLALFLFEVIFFYMYTEKNTISLQKQNIFQIDPEIGYILKPENTIRKQPANSRRKTVNKFGYIGPAYPPKKNNSSTLRILTLGGSTTYGVGADENETYPYYLDSLMDNDRRTTEVINLAVGGYSTYNNLLNYQKRFSDFEIDILIVGCWFNDMYYRNATPRTLFNTADIKDLDFDVTQKEIFNRTGLFRKRTLLSSISRLLGTKFLAKSVLSNMPRKNSKIEDLGEVYFSAFYDKDKLWVRNYLENINSIIEVAKQKNPNVKTYILAMPSIFSPIDYEIKKSISHMPDTAIALKKRNYDPSRSRDKFHYAVYYYHNLLFPRLLEQKKKELDFEIIYGFKATQNIPYTELPEYFVDEMHLTNKSNLLLAHYVKDFILEEDQNSSR